MKHVDTANVKNTNTNINANIFLDRDSSHGSTYFGDKPFYYRLYNNRQLLHITLEDTTHTCVVKFVQSQGNKNILYHILEFFHQKHQCKVLHQWNRMPGTLGLLVMVEDRVYPVICNRQL